MGSSQKACSEIRGDIRRYRGDIGQIQGRYRGDEVGQLAEGLLHSGLRGGELLLQGGKDATGNTTEAVVVNNVLQVTSSDTVMTNGRTSFTPSALPPWPRSCAESAGGAGATSTRALPPQPAGRFVGPRGAGRSAEGRRHTRRWRARTGHGAQDGEARARVGCAGALLLSRLLSVLAAASALARLVARECCQTLAQEDQGLQTHTQNNSQYQPKR